MITRSIPNILVSVSVSIAFLSTTPVDAELSVELEALDGVTAANFTSIQPPFFLESNTIYGKSDSSASGIPRGIYRDGLLEVASGSEIDGSVADTLSVQGTSGNSYIMYATARYMPDTTAQHYAIFLMPSGQRILDRTTPFPGYPTPIPHNGIGGATMDPLNGNVAFYMRESSSDGQPSAVVLWQNGSTSVIAKQGDAPGGGTGTFSGFDVPYAEGGEVAFVARGSGVASGIFKWDGSLQKVVDASAPLPEGGTIADTFVNDHMVKVGSDYAFATNYGLYKIVDGQLSKVTDNQRTLPGGIGRLLDFYHPQLKDGSVVFVGERNNQFLPPLEHGIYTDIGGEIETIVNLETDFGERTPTKFSMNRGRAWVEDAIYFRAEFSDGSDTIYKATFQRQQDTLEYEVNFTSATSGTITVETEAGATYTLKRSTTLDRATAEVVSTQTGTGAAMPIAFSPPSPAPPQMYYWVEKS